jgi:hypothetical protein
MNKILSALTIAFAALLFTTSSAFAANSFTLFDGATAVSGGTQLVSNLSDTDTTNDSSGINLAIPSGQTFGSITNISTSFNVTDDDCGGGSPRFQIAVDPGNGDIKNVFAYLGPTPDFIGCAAGVQSSGNLLNSGARFDSTQLGGPFYGTFADAVGVAGSMTVVGAQVVADGGWAFADQEQSVIVSNAQVTFGSPTTKDQCKEGGWTAFSGGFKNQGQCVSSVASGGKAGGNR